MAGTWKDLTDSVNSMASNLTAQVRNIAYVTKAVAAGRPHPEDHRRRQGRDPRAEEHHQHDGGPALVVRLRSHARGARGGHGRRAGRPGRRQGRGRHLEGPHRLRQLHGRQPHRAGAQHRLRHQGRGRRRPDPDDQRRRQGRDPGAEEHLQRDGGSALVVRLRGHARGPRGRHGGQAGRPGPGQGRGRHLEGPHRLRQLHGQQPHRPGPQHRGRDQGRGRGRPHQEDHRRRARARSRS